MLGFRVFDNVPGSLAAAGAASPRSAVVGFSEAGTKVRSGARSAAARGSPAGDALALPAV